MSEPKQKFSMLPIFFVIFLDMLGVGIALPVLAPLFIDVHNSILGQAAQMAERTFMLGLLIAVYPLAQFFGAPILGGLSDHYGRKKLLVVSLAGTLFGYVFFAFGIATQSLTLLFIGRAIDGFTGGNISIAMSSIADMSDNREKAKNFGLVGMAFGLGFIIGPYIGGKLSDPSLVGWFDFSTPFWFAALLTLFNISLVAKMLPETMLKASKTQINPFMGLRNIKRAFQLSELRVIFAVSFLFTFGFNFFTQFFSVFLIEKFSFTQSKIGDLFAYQGFWIAITQGVIMRPLSKFFNSQQTLRFSVALLAVAIVLLLVPQESGQLFIILPFVALFMGLTWPNITATVSNLGAKDSQGEILGIQQSIQALAMSLPPLIAGVIAAFDVRLPMVAASFFILFAWAVFFFVFKAEGKKEVFHEV